MTKEEKILAMVQPKDYISKIKLFCNKCTISEKLFVTLFEN